MPALSPVDYDPFKAPPPKPPKLSPVDHDPFATPDVAGVVERDVPGARITSTLRSAAHNREVGGVPDSLHLRGLAADFVPPAGETDAQAIARIRAMDPHPRELLDEHNHVHYAPGVVPTLTPVDHDPFAAPPAPPASPAVNPPDPHNAAVSSSDFLSSARGEMAHLAHEGMEGYRRANRAGDVLGEGLSAVDVALSPIGGAASAAEGRSPANPGGPVGRRRQDLAGQIAEGIAPLPGVEEGEAAVRAVKGITRAGREASAAARTAEEARALERAGGPGARPAEAPTPAQPRTRADLKGSTALASGRVAEPRLTPVEGDPFKGAPARSVAAAREKPPEPRLTDVIGDEKDPVERVDNALFRAGNHGTEGKIEALQAVRAAPKAVRDPKVQEELTHAIEQQMIDPEAKIPEKLQEAEAVRQPWAERQRLAVNRIKEKLANKGLSEDEIAEFTEHQPGTGYVPRRVEGKSPGIDPADPQRRSPLEWKRGGLGKSTGSLKARDQIVFEDETGKRTFEHRNPTNKEFKPGMQVAHPVTGKPVTVKQATIKEIEAAGARDRNGKLLTYHKNALVNTIDEALRAERVERNIDLLDEITKRMKEEGLAHQEEWHYPADVSANPRARIGGNAPPEDARTSNTQWVKARSKTRAPDNFEALPNIPQLAGWKFDPKVAEVLKDYFPGPDEPIDSVLSTVNRALNASLFITPIPHIKNVATMGFIGRGWDWIPTASNYGRLMRTGRDAIKEVLTLGPRYRKFLHEGAGLQAGDEATRNFYQALLDSAAKGIEGNPAVKASGLNPVEVVKALYSVSHKILWSVNDMVLLQRQMELEAKGMSSRDAIKEAERWIANYRIPTQVFKSRALQQFISNGRWINFGRYTYGKWKAIGEMVKGMAKPGPDRMNAMGKVVAAGIMGLFVYPMLDALARYVTGNKNAHVGMGGELTPVEDLTAPGKGWLQHMAAFMSLAPAVQDIGQLATGKDEFGRDLIDPNASPKGQAVQGAEAIADQYYPTSLGLEALQPGGPQRALGRLGGVNLPPQAPGTMKASTAKMLRGEARSREKKDPLERMLP